MYSFGVFFAVLAGITNFTGQILQKKAINAVAPENRPQLMKHLIRTPVWIAGFLMVTLINVIFIAIAQSLIGAALIPGLTASGFIVLGIGSVKLLGENIKKEEIIAIGLLVIGIIFISLSRLAIEGDFLRFQDNFFNVRIGLFTIIAFICWFTLYFQGKKMQKGKAIIMALGTGFPFVLQNIWVQPLLLSFPALFGSGDIQALPVFVVSFLIVVLGGILGIIHFQHAMAEGNASIVIPIQQIPQQVAPIFIYFVIYMLAVPGVWSYFYVISGILLIIAAGFILSRRQAELEKATQAGPGATG